MTRSTNILNLMMMTMTDTETSQPSAKLVWLEFVNESILSFNESMR